MSIQELREKAFLQQLSDTVSDTGLLQKIQEMYEYDRDIIECHKTELYDRYQYVTHALLSISKELNIDPQKLAEVFGRTATCLGLPMHEVVNAINMYYLQLNNRDKTGNMMGKS